MSKKNIESKIEYRIECLPEDTQIEGNVLASGDDAEDAKAARMVEADLASGNEWAWCTVKVTAYIPGTDLEGTDYLGCCSYASESDFRQPGGYFEDMCNEARRDLLAKVESLRAVICA